MTAVCIQRKIGPVAIDVVVRETHDSELNITRHPVEKGADITDHAYPEPKVISLYCMNKEDKAQSSWEALLAFQEAAEPFTIVTGLKVYSSMLIKGLHATRDKKTARILDFEAVLEEIKIVEVAYEDGGQAGTKKSGKYGSKSTENRAKSTVHRGESHAEKQTNARSESALYKFTK